MRYHPNEARIEHLGEISLDEAIASVRTVSNALSNLRAASSGEKGGAK